MENFTYHNPTKIISGKNTQKQIGKVLKAANIKTVLLVYGKNSIKKSGLFNEVTAVLKQNGIKFHEHPGVKSNPVLSHANEGAALAKKHNVDAVLAVGGGSVLDECKAIAAGAKADCDVWDFYTGTPIKDALPLYTILTISATGSEMNSGSVLTNEKTNEKFNFRSEFCYPRVSIINPELTYDLPNEYLVYSAADVLAHVFEVYFTAETLPLIQKRFMENIIKTVIETTGQILENPKEYDARAEFSIAATWALNNLTSYGTGGFNFPNHMIEHSLSAVYDVPHGAGLAVVIPAWMKLTKAENREIYERFAKEIFGLNSAEQGITALENWFREISLPTTLADLKIDKKDTRMLAENAYLTSVKWGMEKKYTVEAIKDILDLA